MTTIEDCTNQEKNQFGALVSDSDSEDSETASVTLTRLSDYIREVRVDHCRLLSEDQQLEDEEDWETDTFTDSNMKVTVEALEGLCTETISPLHEYDTVILQNLKRILVNILSQFFNK